MSKRVWKKDEFREFIRILKERQVAHWVEIARTLGVEENTIAEWRKLPEAQDAITVGIINTLENMETAGKKDWRMWEKKLKLLGLDVADKVDIKTENPIRLILEKYGYKEGEDNTIDELPTTKR